MKGNKKSLLQSTLFWLVIFGVIIAAVYFITDSGSSNPPKSIQSTTFTRELKSNKIRDFTIRPSKGIYSIQGKYKKPHTITTKGGIVKHKITEKTSAFKSRALETSKNANTITAYSKQSHTVMHTRGVSSGGFWTSVLINFVPNLLVIIFLFIMISQVGGGSHKLLNLGQKDIKPAKSKVRFKDVAGEDAEKQELVEIVEFLKNPKRYTKLGAHMPHGVLLEGPPGTGKTLLAEAVAGEANVPFYSASGSDFIQMFVGVGAGRVRSLFKKAKEHAPSIIFIDEIDAIGKSRGSGGPNGGDQEHDQTLNQLLTEMDGFGENEGVIVIGATNRADTLDPALKRPGRFDRKVLVGRPDVRGRYDILKVHAKGKPFAKNIDLKEIARQTPGFVGADLANLLNEAAILAARYKHDKITNVDLSHAEDRVIQGPAKKNKVIDKQELRIVSDHEAGHTIVGLVLNDARKVHKVTIVPRGQAGGFTLMLPRTNEDIVSKKNFEEQLVGFMGGRVAEEICWHTITTGAVQDFKGATRIARAMVATFGMDSQLGDVQYTPMHHDPYAQPTYSEHTKELIDARVRQYLQHAHDKAYEIIQSHREQHRIIADALLKYETLNGKEIKSLYTTGHMPANDPKLSD